MIALLTTLLRFILHAFRRVYLVHDIALMFNIDFLAYTLVSVRTDVEAPDMNSIIERFFGTVRREALDNFLLPKPGEPEKTGGAVCRSAVLSGLHHHYYKQAV